ncbi:hypothetical protein N0V82_002395 [Gnomoniopsis sp. IMI 355080]|nr:hypothetical protein N0V82_002395 [Gnomoniopsis sp. IMI 355080]
MSDTDTVYPGQLLNGEALFRLLELQPGKRDDAIVVRLLNFSLEGSPPYEALSYAWGHSAETEKITVTQPDAAEVAYLAVKKSCAAALQRLRYPERPRKLWIDAICINQSDVPERNQQLVLMPRIYSGARRVVVYLGESSDSDCSDAVMEWLQDVNAPSESEGQSAKPPQDVIVSFLKRPWFTRVWVMQEVRLATDAVVVCGDKEVSWEAFKQMRDAAINRGRRALPLPYTVQSLVSKGFDRYSWKASYPTRLWNMLWKTRSFGATDPRDKLYAILPLLEWESQQYLQNNPPSETGEGRPELYEFAIPRADYNYSAAQVFTNLARNLVEVMGLEVLCGIVHPNKVLNLPSWVPDWSVEDGRIFHGRRHNMNGFRFMFEHKREHGKAAPWRFSDCTNVDGTSSVQLHLRAAVAGTIVKLGELCNVYEDRFPLEQWEGLCDPIHLQPILFPREDGNANFNPDAPDFQLLSPFIRVLFGRRVVYLHVALDAVERVRDFNNPDSEDDPDGQINGH